MATPKTISFWTISAAAVIGASTLYLFGHKGDEDTAPKVTAEPIAISSDHERLPASAEPQAAPEPDTPGPLASLGAPPAPWMTENAARASTAPALEAPPSSPAPAPVATLPHFGLEPSAADLDAALNEARKTIQDMRKSQGSNIAGNVRLDVLEKNLDIAERLSIIANEMQQLQQANPNMDPNSPEIMQRVKALTELSGKLDMNFLVESQPSRSAPRQ